VLPVVEEFCEPVSIEIELPEDMNEEIPDISETEEEIIYEETTEEVSDAAEEETETESEVEEDSAEE
jgi:hypothetical protein